MTSTFAPGVPNSAAKVELERDGGGGPSAPNPSR
jgi:hypothetical protein